MISFMGAFDWGNQNIVSYYNLDDNVLDELGTHDGTWVGTPAFAPGVINNGSDLETSSGNYIILDDGSGSLDFTTENFSVSAWIKIESLDPASDLVVVGADQTGGWGFYVQNRAVDQNITLGKIGVDEVASSLVTEVGILYHIVVTYDQTADEVRFYLNGTADSLNPHSYSTNFDLGVATNIGLHATDVFDGVIDEVMILNRTLTDAEVLELYNSGQGLAFGDEVGKLAITLDSPLNDTLQSSNVSFNFTLTPASGFNSTNATIFIWDSDGDVFFTNTTDITGNESNSTFFIVNNLTVDNYEWNVFGSSENATGFLSANFSEFNNTFTWVPFEIDNEEFNLDVFETSRQDFLLNVTTLPSVLSVNAILNYNGTRFTADVSCVLGFCQISTAIDIPLVSTGEEQNKSFLWEISVFDGTNSFTTNLTANEQNVTRIHLEECGAVTTETLNFTSFDEQTQDLIDPFSFDASLRFWLGTGTIKRNNSLSNSSISSLQLCFSPATETLFLDATIEYDEANGTNYTKRNYFFQNDQINNVSQDIKLGLLLAEDSTSFILKVQDRDILPVANVIIFTERFYPGEGVFKVVQVSETDDNGRTVGFFETETVEYRFILKQNGTTVLTTNKQKIVGESVPFTLTFTIGEDEGSSWEPFEPIDDLESEILFNKTTDIVSFTYLDTSGDFELGRLIVEKVNASGLQNTVVCSETSVQSSATITCNLTDNSTGQYIARGIITRDGTAQLVEQTSFAIEDFSTIAGRLGLFLGWFIILISVFTFKFNEVAGIILVNLSIIFVNLIGLISFGYVFISAIVAISIIILVVLER